MARFNLKKDRMWGPRSETGWERCGLYNNKLNAGKGEREKLSRSYTTLNRLVPGGTTEGYSVEWDWDLYVLEGDLRIGNVTLGPGDHAVIEANEPFNCESVEGCTLLTVGHDIPPGEQR